MPEQPHPRIITDIIIHCADTPNGHPSHAVDIDRWHVERGFCRSPDWRAKWQPGLAAIGYHYVVTVDGQAEPGRHPDEVGAHCEGHNSHSIGICLVGNNQFTPAQWDALATLVRQQLAAHPAAFVRGHRQYDTAVRQGKTCPNFDVEEWIKPGYVPQPEHIYSRKREA